MTSQEALKGILEKLTDEDLAKVVQYARSLQAPEERPTALIPLRGLWKDLGEGITEEEVREARKGMWGNFPREDF